VFSWKGCRLDKQNGAKFDVKCEVPKARERRPAKDLQCWCVTIQVEHEKMELVKYKLFIKPWCPWCVSARAWLDQAGVVYDAIDVGQSAQAAEELWRVSGQRYVPTLVVEGLRGEEAGKPLVLADFGTDELEEFARRHNLKRQNV
jgi:glutaredoxin